jgi:hypothetical protein
LTYCGTHGILKEIVSLVENSLLVVELRFGAGFPDELSVLGLRVAEFDWEMPVLALGLPCCEPGRVKTASPIIPTIATTVTIIASLGSTWVKPLERRAHA